MNRKVKLVSYYVGPEFKIKGPIPDSIWRSMYAGIVALQRVQILEMLSYL